LTGNITLPTQTPYLPIIPQQIIDDAVRVADAGATSVHIHAKDLKTARPTTEPAVFEKQTKAQDCFHRLPVGMLH
jgi:uncharacterized protein (DUF849 family)